MKVDRFPGWMFFLPFLVFLGFVALSPAQPPAGFRLLNSDEYAARIAHESFYGLYFDGEMWLFVSASLSSQLSLASKAPQWHGLVLQNFWERSAIVYALFNYISNGQTIQAPLHSFHELFDERMAGNLSLPEFVDRFEVDVYRRLREPLYGELGRLFWAEKLARIVLPSLGRDCAPDGVMMGLCQRLYYPAYHAGSFFMQSLRLGLDAMYVAFGYPPSRPRHDIVTLNPRTLNPYFDYWWGNVFTPLCGLLLLLAVTKRGAYARLFGEFFVGFNLARLINASPVLADRLVYFLLAPGAGFGMLKEFL